MVIFLLIFKMFKKLKFMNWNMKLLVSPKRVLILLKEHIAQIIFDTINGAHHFTAGSVTY